MTQAINNRRVLVDSNLLLLMIVGAANPDWIELYKRTSIYTSDSYGKLNKLIGQSSGLIATPNILTEVSNLLNAAKGTRRHRFYQGLASLIEQMDEIYVPSDTVSRHPLFTDLGVTDLGFEEAIRQTQAIALTDDAPLANHLALQGIDTINFNHLR